MCQSFFLLRIQYGPLPTSCGIPLSKYLYQLLPRICARLLRYPLTLPPPKLSTGKWVGQGLPLRYVVFPLRQYSLSNLGVLAYPTLSTPLVLLRQYSAVVDTASLPSPPPSYFTSLPPSLTCYINCLDILSVLFHWSVSPPHFYTTTFLASLYVPPWLYLCFYDYLLRHNSVTPPLSRPIFFAPPPSISFASPTSIIIHSALSSRKASSTA